MRVLRVIQLRLPSTHLPPHSLSLQSPNLLPNLSSDLNILAPYSQSPSHSKTKDGLIMMLLQSQAIAISHLDTAQDTGLGSSRVVGSENLASMVLLDHNYAKPWNWRPENSLVQPTKNLFIPNVDIVSEPSKPVCLHTTLSRCAK